MNKMNDTIYLTTDELSKKIKYAEQTLYNAIHSQVFQLGVHFIKPSRKKILWIWPEIEKWLTEKSAKNPVDLGTKPKSLASTGKSLIHV